MFNEVQLQAFLERFPDHRIEVVGKMVDGRPQWTGRIIGVVSGKEVVVVETIEINLRAVPCSMADALRHSLGEAAKVKDKKKLPASQRTALADGIPGIVRKRDVLKKIEPKPTHGARSG